MNQAINDAIAYLNDGTLTVEMEPIAAEMGALAFKDALEALLDWLNLQTRLNHERPLLIGPESPQGDKLRRVLNRWGALSGIFCVQSEFLDFKPAIQPAEREAIRRQVVHALNPHFFISTRSHGH